MKLNIIALCLGVLLFSSACSKTSASMSPLQAAGCDLETVATQTLATGISTVLSCTNTNQIASDLQVALGNVNFCAISVPAPAAALVAGQPKYSKLGDVKKSDIDAKKTKGLNAEAVKAQGIVASIACPAVLNIGISYLTQAVPSSWSCSASTGTQSVAAALTAACTAAIPL